jgi:hypothetical protein
MSIDIVVKSVRDRLDLLCDGVFVHKYFAPQRKIQDLEVLFREEGKGTTPEFKKVESPRQRCDNGFVIVVGTAWFLEDFFD